MNPRDLIKEMIYKGEIETPRTDGELITLLERYRVAASVSYCLKERIDAYKDMIITAHKYKSKGEKGCYISRIKQGLNGVSNVILNDVVVAVYGVELMTKAIQELIVEERIKVIGKKIHLINQ